MEVPSTATLVTVTGTEFEAAEQVMVAVPFEIGVANPFPSITTIFVFELDHVTVFGFCRILPVVTKDNCFGVTLVKFRLDGLIKVTVCCVIAVANKPPFIEPSPLVRSNPIFAV